MTLIINVVYTLNENVDILFTSQFQGNVVQIKFYIRTVFIFLDE